MKGKYPYRLVITLAGVVPTLCMAQHWQMNTSISTRYNTDNNALLSDSQPVELEGYTLSPQLQVIREKEAHRWAFAVDGATNRYNEEAFDGSEYYLSLTGNHLTERSSLQWGLNHNQDQVRNVSIDINDELVSAGDKRRTDGSSLSWQYSLDEKNHLTAELSGSLVNYDGDGYADYDYGVAVTGWNHQLTETFTGITQLQFTRFNSEYEFDYLLSPIVLFGIPFFPPQPSAQATVETDMTTSGANLGFHWSINEQLSWQLLAGRSVDKSEQSAVLPNFGLENIEDNSISYVGQGYENRTRNKLASSELSYDRETNRFSLVAKVGTNASSNGTLVDSQSLSFQGQHRLNRKLQTRWEVHYDNRESVDEELASIGSNTDKRYIRAKLSLSYALSQQWSLASSLTYVALRWPHTESSPESAGVFLSVTYSPKPIDW